jgi:hypothetical protein
MGILGGKSIWATDILYLNDSQEFHYAFDLLKPVLSKAYMDDDYSGAFAYTMGMIVFNIGRRKIFVVSFSEEPDLLSQWRGYCPLGSGFCIGFNMHSLKRFAKFHHHRLVKCIYDTKLQQEMINDLIKDAYEEFPKPKVDRPTYEAFSPEKQVGIEESFFEAITEGESRESAQDASNRFISRITASAPILKHPSFAEEKEWRLIIDLENHTDKKVSYRQGQTMLTPFVETDILQAEEACKISEIIIGPSAHPELSEISVREYAATTLGYEVNIRRSHSPFRSW